MTKVRQGQLRSCGQCDGPSEQINGIRIGAGHPIREGWRQQIELAPKFGVDVDSASILGIGKINETVVMLLDISKALSTADKELLDKAGLVQEPPLRWRLDEGIGTAGGTNT